MARLPLVDSSSDDADPLARSVLQAVSAARGRSVDPNVYRAVANHPQALQALVQFGTVVYFQNSMTPAQRELAYLTASVTNGCQLTGFSPPTRGAQSSRAHHADERMFVTAQSGIPERGGAVNPLF